MKFKKISMLAILPILISTALACGADEELAKSTNFNGMMSYGLFGGMGFFGFLFMALGIVALVMIIILLARQINKK